ncbi:MAG TPA: hypothetical protein VFL55_24250 [Acetobacteraceae bacterium]|nr:hypothetical protein [Acetobacteraceae bacterium]
MEHGQLRRGETDEFRLPPCAGLVEYVREVRPRGGQRNAEAIGRSLKAVGLGDLDQECGFGAGQAKALLQSFDTRTLVTLGVGDEQGRGPSCLGTQRHYLHLQGCASLAAGKTATSDWAVRRTAAVPAGDEAAQESGLFRGSGGDGFVRAVNGVSLGHKLFGSTVREGDAQLGIDNDDSIVQPI